MKRTLILCAAMALLMGASVPAAVFPSKPDAAFAQSANFTPSSQTFQASAGTVAPTARDSFGITAPAAPPPPPPVVAAAPQPPPTTTSYAVPDAQVAGRLAVWPAGGQVNDGFGFRGAGEFHGGIDILPGYGAPIVAASSGVVSEVISGSGWGQYVKIDHGGGVSTLYAHMIAGSQLVSVGESVAAGQQIGSVGDTGYVTVAHLHFEVWVDGTRVDPMPWLP